MISRSVGWLGGNPKAACALTMLYMAVIFLLSSIPSPEQPALLKSREAPIVEHVIEYSVLGFLLLGSLAGTVRSRSQVIILAISIAILYGISDEIHQLFVPGRDCDIVDVLANSVGSVFGVILGNSGRG